MGNHGFDERQISVRCQVFTVGFLIMAALLIITPIASLFYGKSPFANQASFGFFTALIGTGVVSCTLIVKDAFTSVRKRQLHWFSLIYLLFGIFLLVQSRAQIKGLVVDGQLTDQLLPLGALELLVIGLFLGYKSFSRKSGDKR